MNMADKVYDILRGSFLTGERSGGNWRFIIFLAFLALLMIASGHSFERKVHYLAQLNEKVKEARSRDVEAQRDLMFMQMESTVASKLAARGIAPPSSPPKKIVVKSKSSNGN
jgi:hypothetical protein